jgi:hypothetical protein
MPKQFHTIDGEVYRVDDETGVIHEVIFREVKNLARVQKVVAALASHTATELKPDTWPAPKAKDPPVGATPKATDPPVGATAPGRPRSD